MSKKVSTLKLKYETFAFVLGIESTFLLVHPFLLKWSGQESITDTFRISILARRHFFLDPNKLSSFDCKIKTFYDLVCIHRRLLTFHEPFLFKIKAALWFTLTFISLSNHDTSLKKTKLCFSSQFKLSSVQVFLQKKIYFLGSLVNFVRFCDIKILYC